MIKYICLVFLILCGCKRENTEDATTLRVSVLRGPSAIAFAEWMENKPQIQGKTLSVKIIDSPELMQAALIKGETDLAVLPVISAANLYNKGIRYSLLGCPIWGTLYLVAKKEEEKKGTSSKPLYVFGAGTTPDILTRSYLEKNKLNYFLNYSFSTAREVMQGFIAGKINTAVLSEPFLSMILKKDSSLHIIADLNRQDSSSLGFAQTAILIHPEIKVKREALDSLLDLSCRYANEQPIEVIRILESKEVFPAGMLTPESIERCKIQYQPVQAAQENILNFLSLIKQYEPASIGGKMPDSGFTDTYK